MTSQEETLDVYGFERSDDFDYETYDEFMSEYLAVLTRRLIKWQSVANRAFSKSRKLKRYVRKGIPSQMRAEFWMKISSAEEIKRNEASKYKDLLRSASDLEKSVKDSIKGDIGRTFPENIYFREPDNSLLKPLSNVLTAYASHNRNTGYCQGLNYIAGMLLVVTKDETDSFLLLMQMLDHLLPDFYSARMLGLRVECRVLDLLIKSSHPDLHTHFQRYDVDMELVLTKWFICLFMDVLPIETVLRVWDCLFFEGSKILIRAAYTLIVVNKDKFLQRNDFTEIYNCFREITHDKTALNCHMFLKLCFSIPKSISRSRIDKLRAEATNAITLDNS